jgi:hypothetical protein
MNCCFRKVYADIEVAYMTEIDGYSIESIMLKVNFH